MKTEVENTLKDTATDPTAETVGIQRQTFTDHSLINNSELQMFSYPGSY